MFGAAIEKQIGHLRFTIFFLFCGLLANLIQAISEPGSPVAIAGASTAVASQMGAYIRLQQTNKAQISIQFHTNFFSHIQLPAILVLIIWFLFQLFIGVGQIGTVQIQVGGVALFGQISGFLVGFSLIKVFNKPT